MNSFRNILLFASVVACGLAGCANRNGSASSEPATAEQIAQVRQAMQAADPRAVVGIVIAVLPDENFAAVGDIPVKEFAIGEPITFIDAQQHPLANGIVRNLTSDALHVKYDKPLPHGREPRVGDLAIRFKP